MIKDEEILKNIRSEWTTVRDTWELIAGNIRFSFAGGGFTSNRFRCISYSLTLLFGFTVLENVLQQLRDEGRFQCDKQGIKNLMKASRKSVKWIDYDLVNEARNRRNDVAHHQKWIEIKDCKRYLDAIEVELQGWHIIR